MGTMISVDTGGTFTDTILVDEDGERTIGKASTTPDDPSEGVLNSIVNAAENAGESLESVLATADALFHGTTLTTNTVLERTGNDVGLITTRGHRDAIHIGRAKSRWSGLTNDEVKSYAKLSKPEPIVPKSHTRELDERVDYKGVEVVELDDDNTKEKIADLAGDVDTIAVSLLWSFQNDSHETRVKELAADTAPETPVFLSISISPKLGEYERTVTTVINAYTAPVLDQYVKRLVGELAEQGLEALCI